MGVYIKGVEMPKYCDKCLFTIDDECMFNNLIDADTGNAVFDDCPLVEVAEPLAEGEIYDIEYSRWIPCSEKMPEEREWIGSEKFGTTISDKVLVTFESRGKRFVKPMTFQNGELGCMDKHMMDTVYDEWKAVAWMPLPEPYKESEE